MIYLHVVGKAIILKENDRGREHYAAADHSAGYYETEM